jgi:hypothetical protein
MYLDRARRCGRNSHLDLGHVRRTCGARRLVLDALADALVRCLGPGPCRRSVLLQTAKLGDCRLLPSSFLFLALLERYKTFSEGFGRRFSQETASRVYLGLTSPCYEQLKSMSWSRLSLKLSAQEKILANMLRSGLELRTAEVSPHKLI